MRNPVILGVAATNRPHVRLREHPMTVVVDETGKKMIRVPFMVAGKYKHPLGPLDFTRESFSKMIENNKKGVGDFAPGLDIRHLPDMGAIAWFDEEKGGKIVQEGNVLVGYGAPTDDKSLEIIEKGKYRWASVEFHPDYQSNLEKTYLSGDLYVEEEMQTQEGVITLANPYRDKFGRWASKVGGAVAPGGTAAIRTAKAGLDAARNGKGRRVEFTKGAGEGLKAVLTDGKVKKIEGRKHSKWRKAGRVAGALAPTAAAIAADVMLKKYFKNKSDQIMAKRKARLGIGLEADILPTLVREDLNGFLAGQETRITFPETIGWDDFGLPKQDGRYVVDRQTAEEMLAALNEISQEKPHLFYTEEDMQTLDEALAYIEELENKLAEMEGQVEPEPTEREQALAEKVAELERKQVEGAIALTLAEAQAYRDNKGYGHSAYTLEFFKKLLSAQEVNETIKLEATDDAAAVAAYFRRGLAEYLRTAPGTQPAETKTVGEDTRELEDAKPDLYKLGRQQAKDIWSAVSV